MRRSLTHRRLTVLAIIVLITPALGSLLLAASARSQVGDVVISQVYAGGQSGSAPLRSDYVELFNRGTTPVTIDGWSVQYAAATGITWRGTTLTGALPPGGFYLVRGATGPVGTDLPTPDASGSLAFAQGSGRLALVTAAAPLGCGADPGCATAPGVVDFVGYGPGAVSAEGSAPAPSPGVEHALLRAGGGCIDTNQNASDLTLGQPAPRSSTAPAQPCPAGGTPVGPTPVAGVVRIHDIQGSGHRSPLLGQTVTEAPGVVTALRGNGFWIQDPQPDADEATSEAILVFLNALPQFAIGDTVLVTGLVDEFRPGNDQQNLSTTEITQPNVRVVASNQPLPAPVVLGPTGRMLPTEVIEDDATPDAESGGTFDPSTDGLDFWESLEGMRVQVDDAVVVGPQLASGPDRGAVPVLANSGAGATGRTARGGIVVRELPAGPDFNPEIIFLDSDLLPAAQRFPDVDVHDRIPGPVVGVVDYSFGRYQVLPTSPVTFASGGLQPEAASPAGTNELSVATFNVENLNPGDPPQKFARLAEIIVDPLAAPDLVVLEEVQDNSGTRDDGVVAADATAAQLIAAIASAGGPVYSYRDVPPVNDQDGGQEGGNIRVAFLFRTDRGLAFVDRPGGTATTAATVQAGPVLSASPGRILPDPTDSTHAQAFDSARKPLVGEFTYHGQRLFVVGNHFTSRLGSSSLYGRPQPPEEGGKAKRKLQAEVVAGFVTDLLMADPNALVVVLGDLNDFPFSEPVETLEAAGLTDLFATLPEAERYSYVFQGNSQTLDHMLTSAALQSALVPGSFDVVHVNAEFADQASDHDPQGARFLVPAA
jgi:predicted extracellular nuclease